MMRNINDTQVLSTKNFSNLVGKKINSKKFLFCDIELGKIFPPGVDIKCKVMGRKI